jgi:hypothetical protein
VITLGSWKNIECEFSLLCVTDLAHDVTTQDRVFSYYAPNSSIKHSKSDSKDRSQEILQSVKQ